MENHDNNHHDNNNENNMFGNWKQCDFVNTIGMKCQGIYLGTVTNCSRHRCIFMKGKSERCRNTVVCNNKWYCIEHLKMCQCVYEKDKIRCAKPIYFSAYKTGTQYCEEHKCIYTYCKYCVDEKPNNKYHLCTSHFDALVLCDYFDLTNKKCNKIVEMRDVVRKNLDGEILFDICIDDNLTYSDLYCVSPNINYFQERFCPEHKCCVDKCHEHIRNHRTKFCRKHSSKCEFQQCEDYVYCDNNDDEEVAPELYQTDNVFWDDTIKKNINIYCDKHQCHWKGDLNSHDEICHDHICANSMYCQKHNDMYLFDVFEYGN